MKLIADFCIIPLDTGSSLSPYIAECHRIFKDKKLKVLLHGYGTNLEGEWDDVMEAIRLCHERLHQMGSPRISSTLRLGTRTDRDQSIEDKIESVKTKI